MVPPHVWSDGPPLAYMEQVYGRPTCTYGPPPHVRYDFFRPASKESTACPNKYTVIAEHTTEAKCTLLSIFVLSFRCIKFPVQFTESNIYFLKLISFSCELQKEGYFQSLQ